MGTEFLDIFQIGIGVYLAFFAIRGKGKVYENEYVKEGMEEKYRKTMRLWLAVLSPMVILVGTLGLLGYNKGFGLNVPTILWALTIVGFVMLIVQTSKMTDKTKSRASAAGQQAGPYRHPAFDFDDEDTAQPVPAEEEKNETTPDGE